MFQDSSSSVERSVLKTSNKCASAGGHSEPRGLHCRLRPWRCPGPCCHRGDVWVCVLLRLGLCWCLWPMLPPKAIKSVVCATARSRVDVYGWALVPPEAIVMVSTDAVPEDHKGVLGPTAARLCVDACSPCHHWRPGRCLWSTLWPEVM